MARNDRDWSDLVAAAGLDPREVDVAVVKQRRRRGSTVRASHSARVLSCEAEFCGTTEDNAVAAIRGLVDLLTGGASRTAQ
jgi:uncharacterized protein (UPF0261 family)